MRTAPKIAIGVVSLITLTTFQNCSKAGIALEDSLGKLGVCAGVSCELTPLTYNPAVTTILMALGDEADDQLVVNGASAQLIAETVVRYTSPEDNPKILMVKDRNNDGEDPEDTRYVIEKLLVRYDVTVIDDPVGGLKDSDLTGYDIVWFNNPGHPMGSQKSRDALEKFKGGVILQGDDLAQGNGFSTESLTGLKFIDNGTSVQCDDGKSYNHDNNNGYKFRVNLDASKIPGASDAMIAFQYGNDIDNTVAVREDLEVLASAIGGPATCTKSRPAIVRYQKTQ